LIEKDIEYLLSRKDQFVYVECPACKKDESGYWDSKSGFTYVQCPFCSMIYMNPRPSQDLIDDFYKNSLNYEDWNKTIFPATENIRKKKIIIPRASRLVQSCKQNGIEGGTLLEIGSAFGTFGLAINEQKYFDEFIGVEPTPDLARTSCDRGLNIRQTTIEKLDLGLKNIDVVVAFEVIEHLFNPQILVKSSFKYLRKGGLLVLTCPNSLALGPLLLKAKDESFSHEHINYFNSSALSMLIESHGFKIVESSTPGKLDIDLLKHALESESQLDSSLSFWRHFISLSDSEDLQKMQQIIANSGLSSHLWIVARKC
jgi:2-polyprenyl-3-methyl-5-hydroxy-6-metoxy-1,4-benzoquinol methylase/ribosomal protein S27E